MEYVFICLLASWVFSFYEFPAHIIFFLLLLVTKAHESLPILHIEDKVFPLFHREKQFYLSGNQTRRLQTKLKLVSLNKGSKGI